MKKILIIEDDESIAKLERDFLMVADYQTSIFMNGAEGLKEALTGQYDLILLDLMLPDMDGLEICQQIRNSLNIPILMVTAKTEDIDKIKGLGIGADDYISKPFSPTELVARVKANIAQYERISSKSPYAPLKLSEICYGDLRLNTQSRRVYLNAIEIPFKNREYELLHFLMSNVDIVFSREVLYERIWGMNSFGDSRTVSVHINRLREKLERDPANPEHIQTVWGAGYRFKP
jgi:Response regulators consisting of a CheY-like receiver domain and a winged-helix DNA-binding domain